MKVRFPAFLMKKKFEEYKAQLSAKAIVKDTLEKDEEKQFLKGAEMAYETIITSFAKGNKDELKKLLTKEIYTTFDQAIDQRNKDKIISARTSVVYGKRV